LARRPSTTVGSDRPKVIVRSRRPRSITRRAVLTVLVIASVLIATAAARNPDSVERVQLVAASIARPVEVVASRTWQPFADAWGWGAALVKATRENPELHDRVVELEARSARAASLEEENQRLREIVGMRERSQMPGGYTFVASSVIARSPTVLDRSIVIDRGTDSGIAVNDPVIVARGLLGRIGAVSANTARVDLIINADQAVTAAIAGSPATGILKSVGNDGSPVMRLDYVDRSTPVQVGDLVVTAGWSSGSLESVFPRGIQIGTVTSVGNNPADLYRAVQVTPFADFRRLDEVLVLVPDGDRMTWDEPTDTSSAVQRGALPKLKETPKPKRERSKDAAE
jgi:rod shape-determining protein MreC